MSHLYLDLESIPSQSPAVHAAITETITCPGNITKAESIAAWEAEKKPALVAEAIAKTSFDGAYGHLACIGWAVDGEEVQSVSVTDIKSEANVLTYFAKRIQFNSGWTDCTIVGHNVIDFDIRFLWQRAIILGVRLPAWFPRDPKPWSNDVFDTMTAFAGARNRISMDRLCAAMGLEGKKGMDGSMVAGMWAEGKHDEIGAYCRDDVERTRQIHRRMQIAFGEEAA